MLLGYLSLVIISNSFVSGADILAILPSPIYSHQITYAPLWRELSLRGHKVTLITADPAKNPKLKNLTEIDVSWTYKYFENVSRTAENDLNMWNIYRTFEKIGLEVSKGQLSFPPVQDLIVNNERNFDLVLVEFFYPEFLAFAEIYKCPSILISSLEINSVFHHTFGNPSHPVLNPEFTSPFYPLLDFKERLFSTLYNWYLSYHHSFKHYPEVQTVINDFFNISLSIEELIDNVDLMFLNVNPIIHGARALGPTTINIGGQRREATNESLSLDLKEFLDSAKEGFNYFSLGSNVKSNELNKKTLKAIIETLREIPYKVLWKFESDDISWKPNNVKLVKWAPQQNILSHPNLKLFVTQGGLQSMEESIYSEVPLVVIPFFSDQELNSKIMKRHGIAKTVGRMPWVQKEELKSAILEVASDPRYKQAVKRLRQLILDAPMTGLEKAVWWTEYVIRNKGAKHLRNPAADIPFYQYYLIDVIGFIILLSTTITIILSVLIRKLYKLIICCSNSRLLSRYKKLK